jgi:ribose transport system substrate-binding protein
MRTRAERRVAACTLATVALVAVAGCGSSGKKSGAGSGGGEKPLVGFINGGNDPFYTCLAKGLTDGLAGKVDLVELNSHNDVSTEIANGEDLLARKPKAMVLQTVNVKSGTAIVSQSDRQHVPVVLSSVDFLSDPSKVAGAVVYNLVAGGTSIGDFLKAQLHGPAKVGVIAGAPGAASDLLVQGFELGLKGSAAKIVFNQPAMWERAKAAAVAENMIQADPDLSYVFVANEDMAFGVLKVLQAAGKASQVKIVTSGGTDEGLAAVKNGTFLSTTMISPYSVGRLSAAATLQVLAGKTPNPKIEQVGYPVITKANVASAKPYCAPAAGGSGSQ